MTDPTHDLQALIEEWRARVAERQMWQNIDAVDIAQLEGVDSTLTECADELEAALTSLRASRPPEDNLAVISRAMSALESDATREQREAAWDELRDVYFPTEGAPK